MNSQTTLTDDKQKHHEMVTSRLKRMRECDLLDFGKEQDGLSGVWKTTQYYSHHIDVTKWSLENQTRLACSH